MLNQGGIQGGNQDFQEHRRVVDTGNSDKMALDDSESKRNLVAPDLIQQQSWFGALWAQLAQSS